MTTYVALGLKLYQTALLTEPDTIVSFISKCYHFSCHCSNSFDWEKGIKEIK